MQQYIVQGASSGLLAISALSPLDLTLEVTHLTGIPSNQLRLTQGNRDIVGGLRAGETVWLSLRLQGGKGGGFGTLLRGQGMIVRVDNFEDCRDLNGRRIRDVNNEIRMREWEKKRRAESSLVTQPPQAPVPQPQKAPPAYRSEVKEAAAAMEDAVRAGIRKRKGPKLPQDQPSKRPEDTH